MSVSSCRQQHCCKLRKGDTLLSQIDQAVPGDKEATLEKTPNKEQPGNSLFKNNFSAL